MKSVKKIVKVNEQGEFDDIDRGMISYHPNYTNNLNPKYWKPVIISDPVELSEGELAAVKDLLGPINHGFTAAGKSALRKLCEQNRIEIKEIISREDALKIASHILETAEKERIEHAEKEIFISSQRNIFISVCF